MEKNKDHKFWNTQPIVKPDEILNNSEPIIIQKICDIKPESFELPDGYGWYNINIKNDGELDEVYNFLKDNYGEDPQFRFKYSREFVRWVFASPKFDKSLVLVIRVNNTKKIVGLITSIPQKMRVFEQIMETCIVNFLCVHKSLRNKRMTPMLIKEITRRNNLMEIWQAVYTLGNAIMKPICETQYYHRWLNPQKIIHTGFGHKKNLMQFKNPQKLIDKLYNLPNFTDIQGFRQMEKKDVPEVHKKIKKFMSKYQFAPVFDDKEFEHWFSPQKDVLYCYVVEDPVTKEITDFCSFYSIPFTVINSDEELYVAYMYHYFNNKNSLVDLIRNLLIVAKQNNFDVFNCLNIMDNQCFFKELKFNKGTGKLNYYLYNYKYNDLLPQETSLVLF